MGTFALFRENAASCAHSISHAETFVFFVLGQRDDGIRVTSEYAAFHKVPSRGALQSFVGDFTAGGGKVLSADIDAITAVETSSNPPEEEMGSSPHERQEAIHIVERQLPKRLKLFRGEDSWFARGRQGQLWEYGTGKLRFAVEAGVMISKAIEAGFVPVQRGDTEANFSCDWTEENIDRLIKLLRLKIRRPASVPSNLFRIRMPEHRNGKISGESERMGSYPDRGSFRGRRPNDPAELDTGPPSKMRSPSWKLGRREVLMERTTIDIYPAAAQLSSALSRLACAALSAEELSEWLAYLFRKEGSCRRP